MSALPNTVPVVPLPGSPHRRHGRGHLRAVSGAAAQRPAAAPPVEHPEAGRRPQRPVATVSRLYPLAPGDLAAPTRLTRRGLLAVAVLVTGLASGLLAVARASAPAAARVTPIGHAPSSVLVRAGDTLWSVATRVDPASDPRAVVARLEHVNHLTGPALYPGEWLRTG